MSRSNSWIWLRNLALLAGAIAGVRASADLLIQFGRLDPFARFRTTGVGDLPSTLGLQLKDVELRHYRGARLVAAAQVERMDVQKDRQIFDLVGISQGVFYGEKQRIQFEAATGNWHSGRKMFTASDRVRVRSADFDLRTASVAFDQHQRMLVIPTLIQGPFRGGELTAGKFTYYLDAKEATATDVSWKGPLDLDPQQVPGAKSGRTSWDVKGKTFSVSGDVLTYSEGYATDGDIIVKATKVELNQKTDVVTATGKVAYFSTKANLLADKAVIYRKEKRAVLTGAVQMLVKPKKDEEKKLVVEEIPPFRPQVPEAVSGKRPAAPPVKEGATTPVDPAQKKMDDDLRSAKTVRDYPVAVSATKIEYFYAEGQRRAIITGSPQARQELAEGRWRYVWTTRALYDGEKETLRLESTPGKSDTRMKTSIGDDMTARWIELSTKEDDDKMAGEDLTGTVYSDDDEIPSDRPKKAGDGGPPPPLRGPIG